MHGQKESYSSVQLLCFSCPFISHSLPTFSHDSGSQSWLSDSHYPSHTYSALWVLPLFTLWDFSAAACKGNYVGASLLIKTLAHRAKEFTDVISISCDYLWFLEMLAQAKWFFFIYIFFFFFLNAVGFVTVWKQPLKEGDSALHGHYLIK